MSQNHLCNNFMLCVSTGVYESVSIYCHISNYNLKSELFYLILKMCIVIVTQGIKVSLFLCYCPKNFVENNSMDIFVVC